MATSVQPPTPMTDPLNMSAPGPEASLIQEEQDEIERQQQIMDRGMPAKNLKKIGILVLGVLATGYLIYPTIFPNKKPPPVKVVEAKTQTDRTVAGSIVEQLKSQPIPAQSSPVQPASAPLNSTPRPSQGLTVTQDGDRPVTKQELEITRRETIIASSMEPTDLKIPPRESRDRLQKVADDPQSRLAKVLSDQNSILEKSIAANSGQAGDRLPGSSAARRSFEDEFVLRAKTTSLEDPTRLAMARDKSSLYQGTIIEVILDRAINTDNPGTARGRVRSDVYDSVTQDTLLIPRGSIVILPYLNSVIVGQARILVVGERIIFPNGKSVSLSGTVASDMQGASGIPADVDNHFYEMFKASFVVGAVSLLLPKNQQQITVTESVGGNTQTGGSILGATLYNTIQKISERNSSIKPTASIEPGEPFTLMLSKDMELEPYRGRK